MGFGAEMKAFRDAWESQSRIQLNNANRALVESKTVPRANEQNTAGIYSPLENPQAGGGIGTTTAPSASGGGGDGFRPTEKDIAAWTDYIGQAAAKRGMDPEIAIKVARSEGLAPGVWQSNLDYKGSRETSYGPFQLFTGGGLGNAFQKDTGLDPSDPKNVLQTIDYALDHAKQNGWGAWHGWKGDPWAGINRSGRSDESPYTYTPSGTTPVAGVDQTKTTGIPDDEEDDGTEEAAQAPAEGEKPAVQPVEIDAPEVQPVQLVQPRVELDEFGEPVMMAAGGAIPDDVTDLYATSRAYNAQATPQRQGANSGVTAKRITLPGGTASSIGQPSGTYNWRNWGAGTPSQIKFRTQPAPVQQAPAAPVQQTQQPFQVTEAVKRLAHAKAQRPTSKGHELRQQREIAQWQAIVDQERAAKGFARGGAVPDFNEWKRRETRMSGRAEEAGQGARDQAARRMNMRERGIDSTAYKDPSTRFPPRPAAPGGAAKPSLFKTPPPRTSTGPEPGPAPDWAFEPVYEPGNTGSPGGGTPRTQPLLGSPATPDYLREPGAEPEVPIDVPSGIYGSLDEDLRRAGLGPGQTAAPAAPSTSAPLTPYMYARGGAIPDDDRPVMRSQRAESANLGPKKAKARARTDPWEGLRTKESKPVRKPTKKGGRNAGKRAKPKQQRTDPTTGAEPPIPTPTARPGKPEMYTGDFSGPSDVQVAGGKQGRPTPGPRPAPYTGEFSGPSDVRVAGGKGPRLQLRPPDPSRFGPERGTTSPSQLPQGQVVDGSVRRGVPGAISPSGQTSRLPANPGAPNVATRRVDPAAPAQPPRVSVPETNYLKAGMSTIADFIDMLSPEDYARPVDDLAQLNISPGPANVQVAGGKQGRLGFGRGGAIPDDDGR